MPVSATRRLMTGGWGSPKIDIKDPVFYAPLWRPDMVAGIGAIKDGTGTMDVSPQNLAVGANTITVTAAGTLTVYMPEGGTVASGTMTVTGSPVTVSAGIATTITTTGAIGNITVTPSNIIRSKDTNNLAMTITGASWGNQGYTLDGDDNISMGDVSALNITGDFTIMSWVYITDFTPTKQAIFAKNAGTGFTSEGICLGIRTGGRLDFFTAQAAANQQTTGTNGDMVINTWYFCAATRSGAVGKVYQDGVDKTAVSASHVDPTYPASTARIGNFTNDANGIKGTIGMVIVDSRLYTLAEMEHVRLTTKWRYS